MTDAQFAALAKTLEKKASQNEPAYRRRTLLLAATGYLYIGLILLIILALLGVLGWLLSQGTARLAIGKMAFIVAAAGWAVVRSLWVRWPEPDGIRLQHQDAPALFATAEAIRDQLKAPRIHQILLNNSYNASMEQKPRLGILGWPRGYLHIGLPLLQALNSSQFRSVLAHELAHLSGNHARLSAWVYHVRLRWLQVMQQMEKQEHFGSWLFKSFFQWYAPYLNAYSFVMARQHEYEADQRAAEITGVSATAGALVAMDIQGLHLHDTFWPGIYKRIQASPEAPADVYSQLRESLRGGLNPGFIAESLGKSMQTNTDHTDTHPCMRERIEALGITKEQLPDLVSTTYLEQGSAAEHYFGEALTSLTKRLDQEWHANTGEWWKQQHEGFKEKSAKLFALDTTVAAGDRDAESLWTRAELAHELLENEEAQKRFQDLIDAHPHHAAGHYRLGESLLEAGNEQGLDFLKYSMELDSDLTAPACDRIARYLQRCSRQAEAEVYARRAEERWTLQRNAELERENIGSATRLKPHHLDENQLAALQSFLSRCPSLQAAYMVQREVRYLPEKPAYLLALVGKRRWRLLNDYDKWIPMRDSIANHFEFPGETQIFLDVKKFRNTVRLMKLHPGSQIFPA